MAVTVILVVSIALQLFATLLALRLVRVARGGVAWGLMASAIGLMAVRRIVTAMEGGAKSLPAELVALTISTLVVLGLTAVRPWFARVRRVDEIEAAFGQVLGNSLSEFYVFGVDDLRFRHVSIGAQENLGYSADELASMTPPDLKREFTPDSFRELLAPLVAGESSRIRFQSSHQRKDGSRYPVDVDIQLTTLDGESAAVATILDTTERAAAERGLRESEEQYRSLIEYSQDVATVLELDGTVAYVSPSIQWILGHDPEALLGGDGLELVHREDLEGVKKALSAAGSEPDAPHSVVYRLRHADGSWHMMEGVGSVRRMPDGKRQFVINQRDVSKRASAEQDKARAEAQLQLVQRMETLWTLTGGVAHDFNNLLTPIIGYASLLEDELADRPREHEEASEILRAAKRAQQLVQQMLVFSRQTDKEMQTLEFQEVVREAVGLARSLLPSDISMELQLEAPGEAALVDPTQIHQVIMNLCSNAEQAMRGSSGALTIKVERIEALPAETEGLAADLKPPLLRLSVRDSGPGMDEDTVQRIFDPFFTTKGVGEGTGLGLAIVQGIVLDHDGVVTVDTAPGQGATFKVYLPALGERDTGPLVTAEEVTGGTELILIVDDEKAVARVLQRILETWGYRSTAVNSPEAALDLLSSQSVDLMITDQTMPSMTGLDLTERVRRIHPQLPVILVTGFSHSVTPEKLEAAGVSATLTKPFVGPELAGCVRSVLDAAYSAPPPGS